MADAGDHRPPIRVLLAVGNPERERRLRDALSAEGLVVAERCLDGPSLAERAQASDTDVALASTDLHRLTTATLLAIREAQLPLVLLAEPTDIEKYAALAHILPGGCSGQEVTDAVRQAVERGAVYGASPAGDGRQMEEKTSGGSGPAGGRVIALLSGKGAPGVTTVAIGLAAALSERGRRVVLVDADLRGGNVGPYLDLDPRRGLVGLAFGRNGASAAGAVEEELQEGPGFMVLSGLERPDSGLGMSAELVTAAFTTLRETFDDVLVDVGEVVAGASSPASDAVLRGADRLLVVVGADLVALWNARVVIRHVREGLGVAPEAVGVVLNRREGREHYAAEEVERALDLPVLAVLPEDRRAVRRAVAEQLPVTAAGGPVAREVRGLGALLLAESVTEERAVTGSPRRFPFALKGVRRS
ncbi:MAG: P-loop NTPase [Dehalococcoidia bacterium]|nr:P-loop NTPase [Dehalococcoidia bacterium]